MKNIDTYYVLGNPVAHSQSPWIHSRFAELTGQTLRYDKRHVELDGFKPAVDALIAEGALGCNITVPFKFEAAALAERLSERAALAQAVNVLSFTPDGILGDNSDGVGLANDIQGNAGFAIAGRRVLLLGAGGAAAGVLGPLIAEKPAHITVANRTLERAEDLVTRHTVLALLHKTELTAQQMQGLEADFDLIVNATASSLKGEALALDRVRLAPGALAYDMMYGTKAQPFLAWASTQGAVVRDGLGMLVEQAGVAFTLWRGVVAPTAQVLAELRTRVA